MKKDLLEKSLVASLQDSIKLSLSIFDESSEEYFLLLYFYRRVINTIISDRVTVESDTTSELLRFLSRISTKSNNL